MPLGGHAPTDHTAKPARENRYVAVRLSLSGYSIAPSAAMNCSPSEQLMVLPHVLPKGPSAVPIEKAEELPTDRSVPDGHRDGAFEALSALGVTRVTMNALPHLGWTAASVKLREGAGECEGEGASAGAGASEEEMHTRVRAEEDEAEVDSGEEEGESEEEEDEEGEEE